MATIKGGHHAGIYRIRVDRAALPPKFYIGQAAKLAVRLKAHLNGLRAGRHRNPALQNAFIKYGETAVSFQIALICERRKDVLSLYEQSILDSYRQADVYNIRKLCVDSSLGIKVSLEVRQRLSFLKKGIPKPAGFGARVSAAQKGRKRTDEENAKNSACHIGLKQSAESREKKRIALLGRRRPLDVCAKISSSKKGKPKSAEHRAKISAAQIGRKQSPETVARRVASFALRRAAKAAQMELL